MGSEMCIRDRYKVEVSNTFLGETRKVESVEVKLTVVEPPVIGTQPVGGERRDSALRVSVVSEWGSGGWGDGNAVGVERDEGGAIRDVHGASEQLGRGGGE